jgi:hypothetical protein
MPSRTLLAMLHLVRSCRLVAASPLVWSGVLVCSGLVAGCGQGETDLSLDDLSAAERQYVTRFVVLERARVVTLADPELGASLLDSLAAAWGDTADAIARAALPAEPARAAALHDLVRRVLEAEADSLIQAPRPDRLSAPLPEPVPD